MARIDEHNTRSDLEPNDASAAGLDVEHLLHLELIHRRFVIVAAGAVVLLKLVAVGALVTIAVNTGGTTP